jgi:hypothetical protein
MSSNTLEAVATIAVLALPAVLYLIVTRGDR